MIGFYKKNNLNHSDIMMENRQIFVRVIMNDDMTYELSLDERNDEQFGDFMLLEFGGDTEFKKKGKFTMVNVLQSLHKQYGELYKVKSAIITGHGKFNILNVTTLLGTHWLFTKEKVIINGERYTIEGTKFIFQF